MVGAMMLSAALFSAAEASAACEPTLAGHMAAQLAGDLDFAGDAVAVSGQTVLVGAPLFDAIGGAPDSGGAFVFRRAGQQWIEEGFLGVPTARAGERVGFAVALDGDTAVISSPYRRAFDGEVFVYRRIATPQGPRWEPEANIKPPETGSLFGHDVALEGDVLAVGHPFADASPEGCVQIYLRFGGQWVHAARVRAPGATSFDLVGTSVALRGRWLVAGAPLELRFPTFGSAYVFERTGEGWLPRGRLVPSDGFFEDQAGHDVAVDEPYLAISSTQAFGAYGRVWMYRYDGAAWIQEQTLEPPASPRPSAIRLFGVGIALSGDRLAVGAPWWDQDGGIFGYGRVEDGWALSAVVGHRDVSRDGFEVIDLGRAVGLEGTLMVGGAPFTRVGDAFTGAAVATELPSSVFGVIRQPADQSLALQGDKAHFEVSATGPGTLAYQWTFEGAPLVDDARIRGAATPRLEIQGTRADDAGEYRCLVISDECGQRASEPAYLFFGDCVRMEEGPGDRAVTPGDASQFVASAIGLGPLTYQWYRSGVPLEDGGRVSGATTPILRLSSTLPEDAGGYVCLATARCGSAVTSPAELAFIPCAWIEQSPASATLFERDIGVLRVEAGGTRPLTYQWLRDGAPLTDDGRVRGVTTPELLIHPLSRDDSGQYACIVSCGYTAAISEPAALTVSIRPCFGDSNHDNTVDLVDLSTVLLNFGRLYGEQGGQGDADFNRSVNLRDVSAVLANFGDRCAE